MLERYSTNATVAKIRAMYGKMLVQKDYEELLSKQSVTEVAAYLKANTHYSEILSSVDTNSIHRGFLETLVRRNNFDIYVKLCKFQELDKHDFYNYEIISDEIHQILSCILHVNSNDTESYIETLPGYLIQHSKVNFINLAKQTDMKGILQVLKNTPYYKVLKDVHVTEDGKIDFMNSELLLRTYFYNLIFETINKEFSGDVSKQLTKNVKTQIDLINMINAFRMKEYFNAEQSEIKQSMLPFYGQISKKKMYKIYEAKDGESMRHMIDESIYAKQIDIEHSELVEKCMFELRYKNAKRSLCNAQDAPVAFYSFMYLCEVEAINIISITEGIRYKASPSYIEKLLIM